MAEVNYTELQSKTIDFLRFPLMLMVVFIHTPHLEINMQGIDSSNFTSMNFYSIIVTLGHYTLTNIAVPCFFMISGFLFFYKVTDFSKNFYFNKLKNRVFTLLIPYLLWNALMILIFLVLHTKNGELSVFVENILDKGLLSVFWNYSSWKSLATNQTLYGPALLSLWFLRDLILSVILSPIIFYIVKYTRFFGIIALGLLYYFKVGFVIFDYNLNQLITAVFFFALGSYFSLNAKNIVLSFRKLQKLWMVLAIISLICSVYYYQTQSFRYILPFYTISGIITIVNITSFLLERNRLKEIDILSRASFFIYLSHPIFILSFSNAFLNKILPFENYVVLTIKYLVTPILCVTICIIIYWVLNRYLQKITKVIVGGR